MTLTDILTNAEKEGITVEKCSNPNFHGEIVNIIRVSTDGNTDYLNPGLRLPLKTTSGKRYMIEITGIVTKGSTAFLNVGKVNNTYIFHEGEEMSFKIRFRADSPITYMNIVFANDYENSILDIYRFHISLL